MLQFLVRIWFGISGTYRCTGKDPKTSPMLVLTNHNTNWDFLYFGASFSKHMYYVASEHIFRSGFVSKAIKFLVSPVARKKGASSAETVSEIKSRLSRGYNVCMMADGNRSFYMISAGSGHRSKITPPRISRTRAQIRRKRAQTLGFFTVESVMLRTFFQYNESSRNPTWSSDRSTVIDDLTVVYHYG